MLVAAEASGDALGGGVAQALRRKLGEGVRAYPRVLRRVRETVEVARVDKPDVAVLIDSWGFTLRVAKALRRLYPDLPLIKYVGPQVWATRPGRTSRIASSALASIALRRRAGSAVEKSRASAGAPTKVTGNPWGS